MRRDANSDGNPGIKIRSARLQSLRKLTPKNEKPANTAGLRQTSFFSRKSGAGEGARTLDPDLGKVVLYH
jgi:hypothetical protein